MQIQILVLLCSVISVANKCRDYDSCSEQKSSLSEAAASIINQRQQRFGLGGCRLDLQQPAQLFLRRSVVAQAIVTKSQLIYAV